VLIIQAFKASQIHSKINHYICSAYTSSLQGIKKKANVSSAYNSSIHKRRHYITSAYNSSIRKISHYIISYFNLSQKTRISSFMRSHSCLWCDHLSCLSFNYFLKIFYSVLNFLFWKKKSSPHFTQKPTSKQSLRKKY
jgi:hypothetical protein